jgi:hypothetical protein
VIERFFGQDGTGPENNAQVIKSNPYVTNMKLEQREIHTRITGIEKKFDKVNSFPYNGRNENSSPAMP